MTTSDFRDKSDILLNRNVLNNIVEKWQFIAALFGYGDKQYFLLVLVPRDYVCS
jgi:hypothetical protein